MPWTLEDRLLSSIYDGAKVGLLHPYHQDFKGTEALIGIEGIDLHVVAGSGNCGYAVVSNDNRVLG